MSQQAENAVVRSCLAILKVRGVYAFRVTNRAVKGKTGWFFHGTHGISDILGVLPGGRIIAVECKTATGKTTPAQDLFLNEIAKKGGLTYVARSGSELNDFLDSLE